MVLKSNLSSVLLAGALCGPLFAQEAGYKSDASVQFFGTFASTPAYNSVGQSATDTGGVLASYRYFFDDINGFEINYGWAPGSQKFYNFPALTSVRANSDEATAAYVIHYPEGRWRPFGLLGGGALVFEPLSSPYSAQARAALLWGGGIDVGFLDRYFLRAEYRGLYYGSPDFNQASLNIERIWMIRTELSIGFGLRF